MINNRLVKDYKKDYIQVFDGTAVYFWGTITGGLGQGNAYNGYKKVKFSFPNEPEIEIICFCDMAYEG